MKKKITKDEFSKLSAELQKLYKVSDDGEEYKLELEDDEDVSGLKSAFEKLKEERKILKEKIKKFEEQEEEKNLDANKSKGDIEALEKSYKEKIKTLKDEHKAAVAQLTSGFTSYIRTAEISKLASDWFKSAKLGIPHLRDRISVELDDELKPVVRVLDNDGRPSSSTLDELKNELLTDRDLAPILKITSASGGQASIHPDLKGPANNTPHSKSGGAVPEGFYKLPLAERLKKYDELPDPPMPNR